jgi:hypothetical protein
MSAEGYNRRRGIPALSSVMFVDKGQKAMRMADAPDT